MKAIFYEVPAGTPSRPCFGKTCTATIYLIDRPSGKKMPVHCDTEGGHRPSKDSIGLGVNHYTDCSDPGQFHRGKKDAVPTA